MGMSHKHNIQATEEIVVLGDMGHSNAVSNMLHAISDLTQLINIWNDNIARLSEQLTEGKEEDEKTAKKRQKYVDLVNRAKEKIKVINKLHKVENNPRAVHHWFCSPCRTHRRWRQTPPVHPQLGADRTLRGQDHLGLIQG